jgi:hypothetical protein
VSNFAQPSPPQRPSVTAKIRFLDIGATVGALNLSPVAKFFRGGEEFQEAGG